MTAQQMVEAVHEHFPNKGGLRVLADLNAELRRYAEDVRAWHGRVSLFEQELVTEDGHDIVTHTGETIQAEQYGSSFPLPDEVFIVREKHVTESLYVDVNGRTVTLFQDRAQENTLEFTQENRDNYSVVLDCVLHPRPLSYDSMEDLANHSDAIVAGVLASYYGAMGNYNAAGWWKKESLALRRKAKEAQTTDGSFELHAPGILTPVRNRR